MNSLKNEFEQDSRRANLKYKTVSIVVAILNEEKYLTKCIDSLINQTYPKDKYEIIIVDGMSTDRTPEIVNEYTNKFPFVKAFNNPKKTQASGRNVGIKHSSGEIIWMFDGHSYSDSRSLERLITILNSQTNDVAAVGGRHSAPPDETFLGEVIFEVQRSILGGAGTSYRQPERDEYVKTVAFAAYRRSIFDLIGGYDEKFVIGEDLEMNWRIKKKGFKLLFCPQVVNYYYRKHNSLQSLMTRMTRYGLWRMMVTKKHPDSFSFLFCFPLLLLISILGLPILVLLHNSLALLVGIILSVYLVSVLLSSMYISIKRGSVRFMICLPIYLIEHVGIAIGMFLGIFKRLDGKMT